MPNYLLLLHESTTAGPELSPDEIQAIIERYMAWSTDLRAQDRLVRGDKLRDGTGRMLRRDGESLVVHDGPYAEAREVVGGFYLIRAGSLDEAQAISMTCPHLDLGGTIELREIEDVGAGADA